MNKGAFGFSGHYFCSGCNRRMILEPAEVIQKGKMEIRLKCRVCDSVIEFVKEPDHIIPAERE